MRWTARGATAGLVVVLLLSTAAQAGPGDLDHSFSEDGRLKHDISGGFDAATDVLGLTDRKILAAGWGQGKETEQAVLTRYLPNGDLDGSFGSGGVVTFSTGDPSISVYDATQDGSKVVVVGGSYRGRRQGTRGLIARRNSDGSADESFGEAGIVLAELGDTDFVNFHAVERLDDGKFVVAGIREKFGDRKSPRLVLARFDADGALDRSFSENGWSTAALDNVTPADVELDHEGRIVVAGSYGFTYADIAILRYTKNGELDKTFSDDGYRFINARHRAGASSVIVTRDRILVGGTAGRYNEEQESTENDWLLVAITPDGDRDRSFAGDGVRRIDLGANFEGISDIARQSNGRIVAAGETNDHPFGADTEMCVMRFHPDGRRDESFGKRGKVTISFSHVGAYYAGVNGLALDGHGHAVIAGVAGTNADDTSSYDFALARLQL